MKCSPGTRKLISSSLKMVGSDTTSQLKENRNCCRYNL